MYGLIGTQEDDESQRREEGQRALPARAPRHMKWQPKMDGDQMVICLVVQSQDLGTTCADAS